MFIRDYIVEASIPKDSHVTTAVRGTVGHIAPDYLSTGQSSEKTDVFGFGILLLELITGLRALEFRKAANQKESHARLGNLVFFHHLFNQVTFKSLKYTKMDSLWFDIHAFVRSVHW
jgi:hypothetical protein